MRQEAPSSGVSKFCRQPGSERRRLPVVGPCFDAATKGVSTRRRKDAEVLIGLHSEMCQERLLWRHLDKRCVIALWLRLLTVCQGR